MTEEQAENNKSTKTCHKCGSDKLIRLSSLDKKVCGECGHEMMWRLTDNQKPLV